MVINKLAECPGSTVTDIMISMRVEAHSQASFKLMELRDIGLVESYKSGKERKYYITQKALDIASKINKYVKGKR